MICPKCQRENPEAYRFCLGCGVDLREEEDCLPGLGGLPGAGMPGPPGEAPAVGDGAWRDLPEKPGFVTLTMCVQCDHCAQPVPVNGPVRQVHCANCEGDTPLHRLHEELVLASDGYQQLGSPYTHQTYAQAEPQCARCGAAVPVDAWLDREGAVATIPCPSCGAALPTYPAPAWLKKRLPNSRQVFGGDPEVARAEAGLELRVDEEGQAPFAMACPQCNGGLTITQETPRTMTCAFCGVSVFLPDALWLRLHPARRMRRWTLSFVGALQENQKAKKETIEEKEGEEKTLRELRGRYRENREARQAAEAEETTRKSRKGLFLGLGLGGVGLVAVTVMVILLAGGKGCSWSEGSLTAKGPPLGDVTFTPVKCRSGQRESFRGVILIDDADRVLIRVVEDPVQGALVNVRKPDSCRGSRCEFVRFDRQGCAVFDFYLENTNTTVNDIRVVEGHLKLDCVFKDTGGTVKADLKFKCN